ncbi:MAG: dephospho-CoA kinase [bacterium]|nr:dephospho-CoA kinase [bacterium]
MNTLISYNQYQPNFMAYKLGVTGNIAAGKSTVQKYFEKNGIKCIDVDDVCHQLYISDKNVISQVKELFKKYGFNQLENEDFIDRKKIGKIVSQNKGLRKELGKIVHPAVQQVVDNFVKVNNSEKFVAIFNPLIFESKKQKKYDKILMIKIDPKLQLERLLQRNSFLTETTAKQRIASQMPQDKKVRKSDFVIDNSFGYENTENEVNKVLNLLNGTDIWKSNWDKFKLSLKEYFIGYPIRIRYTAKHKKAFLNVEKELTGKNTLGGYCHDLEKLIMYIIGVPKNVAHNIHVAAAPHHVRNGHVKKPIMAIIDWECARYTKPDKSLNAKDFYEKFYVTKKGIRIPEIEEAMEKLGLVEKNYKWGS